MRESKPKFSFSPFGGGNSNSSSGMRTCDQFEVLECFLADKDGVALPLETLEGRDYAIGEPGAEFRVVAIVRSVAEPLFQMRVLGESLLYSRKSLVSTGEPNTYRAEARGRSTDEGLRRFEFAPTRIAEEGERASQSSNVAEVGVIEVQFDRMSGYEPSLFSSFRNLAASNNDSALPSAGKKFFTQPGLGASFSQPDPSVRCGTVNSKFLGVIETRRLHFDTQDRIDLRRAALEERQRPRRQHAAEEDDNGGGVEEDADPVQVLPYEPPKKRRMTIDLVADDSGEIIIEAIE